MKIDYLANHQLCVHQIAKWCNHEWPWYYNNGDINSAIAFHLKTAQMHTIPTALVALEGNELVGTIAIIEQDLEIRPALTPWLGCLFVSPAYRRQGVATSLIREGQLLAQRLGQKELYAWTEFLSSALQNMGWKLIESTEYQERKICILSCTP